MSGRSQAKEIEPMKIAVLISGGGRTLKNFLDLIELGKLPVEISLVISSSAQAGGIQYAEAAGVPVSVIERTNFDSHEAYGEAIYTACREAEVDKVIMAGFLKFAPLPKDFAGRVVNIHPSLLPAFGGQGMYGDRVHTAVLERGCRVSGVTVHFVDNEYDQGPIIWQQPAPVFADDTPAVLAARIFELEKEAYPHVLRLLANGRVQLDAGRVTIAESKRSRN